MTAGMIPRRCPTRRTDRPLRASGPTDPRSTAGHARPIPEDLLRQASRRLAILALVGCGLWFFGPALGHVAAFTQIPGDPRWARFGETDFIAAGEHRDLPRAVLLPPHGAIAIRSFVTDLGLVYLVTMAFSIGSHDAHDADLLHILDTSPMITWVGPRRS